MEDTHDSGSSQIDGIFHDLYARRGTKDEHVAKLLAMLDATRQSIEEELAAAASTAASSKPAAGKGKNAASSATSRAPTPTDFFGAFLSALESTGPTHAKQLFYLLSVLMPYVPAAVLRRKFSTLADLSSSASGSSVVTRDAATLRALLKCMGYTLQACVGDADAWARPSTAKMLLSLLSFTIDEQPHTRRAAHSAASDLTTLLHAHNAKAAATAAAAGDSGVSSSTASEAAASAATAAAAAASVYASFFVSTLRSTSQKGQMCIMWSLPLLHAVLPTLPEAQVAQIRGPLLALSGLGQPRLSSFSLKVLTTLFSSPVSRLSIRFVKETLAEILSVAPSIDAEDVVVDFVTVVAAAAGRLVRMERMRAGLEPEPLLQVPPGGTGVVAASTTAAYGEGVAHTTTAFTSITTVLPHLVASLVPFFESVSVAVHIAVADALAAVLSNCIDSALVKDARPAIATAFAATTAAPGGAVKGAAAASALAASPSATALMGVVSELDNLLQLPFQGSWPVSLPVIALLYRLLGTDSTPLCDKLVTSLVTVHDAAAAASAAEDDGADFDGDGDDDRRGRRGGGGGGGDDDSDGGSDAGGGGGGRGFSLAAGAGPSASHASRSKRAIMRVLAAAVRAMGAQAFVRLVPFTLTATTTTSSSKKKAAEASAASTDAPSTTSGVNPSRAWVLPLLRDNMQYAPAPLAFFMEVVFPAIRAEDAASTRETTAKHEAIARVHHARVMQLWALLPAIMVAPPDFATGFGPALGNLLKSGLSQGAGRYPELPPIIGRALETAIVRQRAAAGLPPIRAIGALDEDEDGGDGAGTVFGGGEGALTIAGGRGGGGRGGAAGKSKGRSSGGKKNKDDDDDDDDSDDDEDEEEEDGEDGAATAAAKSRGFGGQRDGAASRAGTRKDGTVAGTRVDDRIFDEGGVSVRLGGGAPGTQRNIMLVRATAGAEDLPFISEAEGEANVAVLSNLAKHYLPSLFAAVDVAVLGYNPMTTEGGAPPADAIELTSEQINSRSRKVLDAVFAYMSLSPPAEVATMCGRLLRMLVTSMGALATKQSNVEAARSVHRAAEAAASKGKAGPPTKATGTSLTSAMKEASVAATRVCSLLSLALAVVNSIPDATAEDPEEAADAAAAGPRSAAAAAPSSPGVALARIYMALKPAVSIDEHGDVQKRAYAVLAALFSGHPTFTVSILQEALDMLRNGLLTVSAPARRGRLPCLRAVVRCLDLSNPEQLAVLPSLLGEVLHCLKDSNRRVRTGAHNLLLSMAHAMYNVGGEGKGVGNALALEDGDGDGAFAAGGDDEDEEALAASSSSSSAAAEGEEEDESAAGSAAGLPAPSLSEFFTMVLGGLAASTPHIRSAALRALSSLVHEFSHARVMHIMLGPMLRTVLLMLKEKAREVVVSAMVFVKKVVTFMPPAELHPHLPAIVTAMLVWSGDRKERIKEKVRAVLVRLARKFGHEVIEELVKSINPSDEPLLRHIRKMAARKTRERAEFAEMVAQQQMAAAGYAGGAGEEDEDEDEDGDGLGGEGEGGDGAAAGSQYGGRGSVVSGAASTQWPGTLSRAPNARSKLGAPGSRLGAITAERRANSVVLSSVSHLLPPIGSIVDPSVLGLKYEKKEKSIVARLVGGPAAAGAGPASVAGGKTLKSGASAYTSATSAGNGKVRAGRVADTMLRNDDAENPIDFLDPSAMKSLVGADPNLVAAREARRRKEAAAASTYGFKTDNRGRMVIPADREESAEAAGDDDGDSVSQDSVDQNLNDRANKRARGKALALGSSSGSKPKFDLDEDDDEEGGGQGEEEVLDRKEARAAAGAKGRSIFNKGPKNNRPKTAADVAAGQGWGMARGRKGAAVPSSSSSAAGGGASGYSGAQYKGKGQGDVKSSGSRFQPFAYVPFAGSAAAAGTAAAAAASGGSRFASVLASTSKAARTNAKRGIAAEAELGGGNRGGKGVGGKRGRD